MGFNIGKCGVCGFMGILAAPRVMITDELAKEIVFETDGAYDEDKPRKAVSPCIGCLETPAGVKTENQSHRRLPDSEYAKHKDKQT